MEFQGLFCKFVNYISKNLRFQCFFPPRRRVNHLTPSDCNILPFAVTLRYCALCQCIVFFVFAAIPTISSDFSRNSTSLFVYVMEGQRSRIPCEVGTEEWCKNSV
jgi:hypothetical protein